MDTEASVDFYRAEVATCYSILRKLAGMALTEAPDGWCARRPASLAEGHWTRFCVAEQETIKRAMSIFPSAA